MAQIKEYTLGELATLLDAELIGDNQCLITGLGTLKNSGPGDLSFLSNPAYIDQLSSCSASAIILDEKFTKDYSGNALVSKSPYVCFAHATKLFDDQSVSDASIHPSAIIHADAHIGDSVDIGPNVVVEAGVSIADGARIGAACFIGANSQIGEDCRLHSGVTLYRKVCLGKRVVIHSATVIGADGFGFAFDGEKSIKIHQLGGVNIGDDVEIGAATTIDRGALEDTVIEHGVKIDNQVQIGHNCHIGEHTVICGVSALAGSVTVGKYCILGGGSGAVGHITIADKVQVSARTLVSKSIPEAGMYSSGTGHMKTSLWKRNIVRFEQLDSLAKRIKALEKASNELEKK